MKPRTLASIGAVLLYLWCEVFQASPFAFLEGGVSTAARLTTQVATTETRNDLRAVFRELFKPVKLARLGRIQDAGPSMP